MAAPKGHPQYGGRAKGTPNKSTQDLFDICEKHKLNVFEAMVVEAVGCDDETRFDKLCKLAQYLYAKRKDIDISGGIEPIEIILRNYSSKKEIT